MGIIGTKVDALDHYTAAIDQLSLQVSTVLNMFYYTVVYTTLCNLLALFG